MPSPSRRRSPACANARSSDAPADRRDRAGPLHRAGFDHVTVAEIARAAEVAEQTVYNYFPTKEDLVFWRLDSFEEELLAAVRDRAPGDPALAAFSRFLLAQRGLLARATPMLASSSSRSRG